MAAKPRLAIIHDIEGHIAKFGGAYAEWYVAVTADPKRSLFGKHALKTTGDPWISRRAVDDLQAAEVEDYFKSVRKTKGGNGRASVQDVYVYAYKMRPHTKP